MELSLNLMILIFGVVSAVCAAVLAIVRMAECIYELRKKPELDTLGEIIQVVKNFFTIERYGA